jgi:hypothetical protein
LRSLGIVKPSNRVVHKYLKKQEKNPFWVLKAAYGFGRAQEKEKAG